MMSQMSLGMESGAQGMSQGVAAQGGHAPMLFFPQPGATAPMLIMPHQGGQPMMLPAQPMMGMPYVYYQGMPTSTDPAHWAAYSQQMAQAQAHAHAHAHPQAQTQGGRP